MNSTHLGQDAIGFRERLRTHRQQRRLRRDPWLVLNMATFNFEGGWNRVVNPLRPSATARC